MGYSSIDYTWRIVVDWTSAMTKKHGATVVDKSGKRWDWGQALCRQLHGEDWMNHPEFQRLNDAEVAPQYVLDECKRWAETDKQPEWVEGFWGKHA